MARKWLSRATSGERIPSGFLQIAPNRVGQEILERQALLGSCGLCLAKEGVRDFNSGLQSFLVPFFRKSGTVRESIADTMAGLR